MERTSTLYHQSASFLLTHPDFPSVNVTTCLQIQQPLLHISSPTVGFLCRVYTFIRRKSVITQALDYKERKVSSWAIPERKAYSSLPRIWRWGCCTHVEGKDTHTLHEEEAATLGAMKAGTHNRPF